MGWLRDGCIRRGDYRRREGTLLRVKLRHGIVTNGAFATQLFSNYFEDLFMFYVLN